MATISAMVKQIVDFSNPDVGGFDIGHVVGFLSGSLCPGYGSEFRPLVQGNGRWPVHCQ